MRRLEVCAMMHDRSMTIGSNLAQNLVLDTNLNLICADGPLAGNPRNRASATPIACKRKHTENTAICPHPPKHSQSNTHLILTSIVIIWHRHWNRPPPLILIHRHTIHNPQSISTTNLLKPHITTDLRPFTIEIILTSIL